LSDDEEVEVDPLAVAGDEVLSSGDRILKAITASDPGLLKQRPRDRMYDYAINRMRSIQVRQEIDGDEMLAGWRREYLMMQDVKNLIEWMERRELEKKHEEQRSRFTRKR